MADVAFAFFLIIGLISGLRRGFVKPAIGIAGLFVASFVAVNVYPYSGPFAAQTLHLPAQVGFLVGGLGSFFLVYFLSVLIGRLVWKGARGQTAVQRVDDAAGGAADAIAGNTAPGPVTMMLRPVPTAAGVLYWLDKFFGSVLGLAQGALAILLVLFAASMLPMGSTGHRIRDSSVYKEYKLSVEPEIDDYDAVRFVRSIGDIASISDDVEEKPALFDTLATSKELESLRNYSRVQDLANDPALKAALASKRYGEVVKNEKVVALLTDREVLRRILAVDWKAVRAQVDAVNKGGEGGGQKTEEKPREEKKDDAKPAPIPGLPAGGKG